MAGDDSALLWPGRGEPLGLRLALLPGGDAAPDVDDLCLLWSVSFVVLAFREDVTVTMDEPLFDLAAGNARTQPPLASKLYSARLLTLGSILMSTTVLEACLE